MIKNFFHKAKLEKSDIPGGWPSEASNIEDLIDEHKKVAVDLIKCISNCIPSYGIPDAGKRFKKIPESKVGTSFIDAGDKFQSTKPELRPVYVGIGEAATELASNRSEMETGLEERIVNHLKKLSDDELSEIQKERKNLSKYCTDLRTAKERVDNADPSKLTTDKLNQMKSNQEEMEQRAQTQKDQTLKALFQFDARCRENSLHILEYLELLQTYHSKCAESLQQRIPEIRKHIEKSMVSPAFRTPLHQHLSETNSDIAYVLEVCIAALNKENALKEEGLFRTAGSKTKVDILTHALDAKRANCLIHECEYSVIADALKQYFRSMEEPLLLSSLFEEWMRAMQQPTLEDKMRALWNLIHSLPKENRINLRYLIKFLAKVSTFSEYNRMNPANLGIVFGPNLLKPNNNSGPLGMMSTSVQTAIVELMITHADWFFPDSADMFAEFTKEPDSNRVPMVTQSPVASQDGAYVNLAHEANGSSQEDARLPDAGEASPISPRKSGGLSLMTCDIGFEEYSTMRSSFSPGSGGTMQRRKAPAPLPPGGSRLAEAGDEPHAKSMPSVLMPPASLGAPPGGTAEEGLGEATISINAAEGTVKTRDERQRRVQSMKVRWTQVIKSSTMPPRPASMPPKPLLAHDPSGAAKGPPPRPKKPSFNPPAPPEAASASVGSEAAPPGAGGDSASSPVPPRPVEPLGPKPRSIGSISDAETPESTHL